MLICAALLALKQLTETTDNIYRYGLLQRLGGQERNMIFTVVILPPPSQFLRYSFGRTSKYVLNAAVNLLWLS